MRVSDEDLTGMDQCVGIFLGDEAIDTWTHVRAELLALRKVADAALRVSLAMEGYEYSWRGPSVDALVNALREVGR